MSNADKIFVKMCTDILTNGTDTKGERVRPIWKDTGEKAYTKKIFGHVARYDLREEFPALTLRKTGIKSAINEVLWIFQKKSNNIHDLKPHIWDSWADPTGSIGKAYGYQIGKKFKTHGMMMDQMDNILFELKNTPYSRRMITSIYNHSENKLYSSSKDNKINKAKSNSILKSKYSKNKIDNKKFLKLNKNIDNINIPLKIQKTDSVQKRNNDRIKNYKTIKKLELNKIINYKNKPKQGVDCHLERININSNFKTIKCLGNQLTERNNVHINNIINNKKYGFLENNLNNKKTKNSSSSLQKTIPSLKGTSSIDNKSTIKKGLINSIYDYNNQNNQEINNNKRKSNNNILKNMNKNKLIKKIETNNYENKNKNNANWNKNKANILSNNNIMVSKIRKISPINKKKQFIKTSISSDINITDSNKELSDLNKLVNNKINTIKIKEIKSIKISNIQKNDIKSRTSRRSNNFRNINDNNIKVKFGEDLGNISYKKDCNEKNGKNIKKKKKKRLNIKKKNINKFN